MALFKHCQQGPHISVMKLSNSYHISCVTSLININNPNYRDTRKAILLFSRRTKYLLLNCVMRFSHLEAQVTAYLFLVLLYLSVAENRQVSPSTLSNTVLEALNITTNEKSTKSGPASNHGLPTRRFPSSFSYFSNCPFKQGVVFLGGPCGPMQAMPCGGFGCASGIGFPISTACCKLRLTSALYFASQKL